MVMAARGAAGRAAQRWVELRVEARRAYVDVLVVAAWIDRLETLDVESLVGLEGSDEATDKHLRRRWEMPCMRCRE